MMFGIHDFLLFVLSGLLLNLTPGADMLYVASRSADHGLRGGLAAASGVFVGILCHIALAAVGLSALLATSPLAFTVVKYAGAAYLVYLGVVLIAGRNHGSGGRAPSGHPAGLWRVFRQGVLINVLNPKIVLFFLAFLPQFIDAGDSVRPMAFLVLGLTFNVSGMIVNGTVAWCVPVIGKRLAGIGTLTRWLKRVAGSLFIGLGIKLAVGG